MGQSIKMAHAINFVSLAGPPMTCPHCSQPGLKFLDLSLGGCMLYHFCHLPTPRPVPASFPLLSRSLGKTNKYQYGNEQTKGNPAEVFKISRVRARK